MAISPDVESVSPPTTAKRNFLVAASVLSKQQQQEGMARQVQMLGSVKL